MAMLDKDKSLFIRDGEGKLIPQKITLTTLEDAPEIKVLPMTRGELAKLNSELKNGETNKDQDGQIILNYLIEPKYTEEEIQFLKPTIATAIVLGVIAVSTDLSMSEVRDKSKGIVISEVDAELKKKSMTNN